MDISIDFIAVGPFTGTGGNVPINFLSVYPVDLGCVGINGIGAPINDVVARVTTKGREMIALSLVDGSAFRITEMALGTGGYDVSNPIMALPIDPTHQQLDNEIHRKLIDLVESPNLASSRSYIARFNYDSFTGGVGELGLWAEILDFPSDPTMVGSKFLFAIAHQGLNTKSLHHVLTYRVFVTI